jgi:hypothetical protein
LTPRRRRTRHQGLFNTVKVSVYIGSNEPRGRCLLGWVKIDDGLSSSNDHGQDNLSKSGSEILPILTLPNFHLDSFSFGRVLFFKSGRENRAHLICCMLLCDLYAASFVNIKPDTPSPTRAICRREVSDGMAWVHASCAFRLLKASQILLRLKLLGDQDRF